MSEHRTEVGGWQAIWRLDRHRIRMMLVRNVSESLPLMSVTTAAAAPDLAQMREQFPRLSRLWDAVRQEYWAECLAPQEYSQGTK
ncbi:hypothetical protein [Nocardia sp. NPDC052112]|uniref:hypothetical protein n=1 Tax=Nocardia sp. NPDC052112 TaxID=3155646 RepID=UPI0034430089